MSPRTPRSETTLDKFTWRWVELDAHNKVAGTLLLASSRDSPRLPLILRATKQGNNGFITQLLEQGFCGGLLARDGLFLDVLLRTAFTIALTKLETKSLATRVCYIAARCYK